MASYTCARLYTTRAKRGASGVKLKAFIGQTSATFLAKKRVSENTSELQNKNLNTISILKSSSLEITKLILIDLDYLLYNRKLF